MIIAVDFDGTIVEHEFPEIGSEMPEAIKTLEDLQKADCAIVIWTCRTGSYIQEMMNWFDKKNFTPNAVNCNVVSTPGFAVPKILADIYIDDRNFGGFPGWQVIRDVLLTDPEEATQ